MGLRREKAGLSPCIYHGEMMPLDMFYKSDNPLHGGYIPYCKECCKKIFDDYLLQYKTLEPTLYFTCAEIGIPFKKQVFDIVENLANTRKAFDILDGYMKELEKYKKKNGGRFDGFHRTDVDYKDIASLKQAEITLKNQIEELKLKWGNNDKYTVEDYQSLEYKFDTYTKDIDDLKPAQALLYKRLCVVELTMEKKDEKGESAKDEQAMILTLMKTLKIDNFTETKERSLTEQMLETRIYEMEMNEPAFFYKDLKIYADHMGLGNYWLNHVIRPIKNVLLGQREYHIIPDDDDIIEDKKSGE